MSYDILVLNPGSTSTKAAVYRDERPLMFRSVIDRKSTRLNSSHL